MTNTCHTLRTRVKDGVDLIDEVCDTQVRNDAAVVCFSRRPGMREHRSKPLPLERIDVIERRSVIVAGVELPVHDAKAAAQPRPSRVRASEEVLEDVGFQVIVPEEVALGQDEECAVARTKRGNDSESLVGLQARSEQG